MKVLKHTWGIAEMEDRLDLGSSAEMRQSSSL